MNLSKLYDGKFSSSPCVRSKQCWATTLDIWVAWKYNLHTYFECIYKRRGHGKYEFNYQRETNKNYSEYTWLPEDHKSSIGVQNIYCFFYKNVNMILRRIPYLHPYCYPSAICLQPLLWNTVVQPDCPRTQCLQSEYRIYMVSIKM